MNYQSIKDGLTIEIQVGDSDHRFWFEENGVTVEFGIKAFTPRFIGKEIMVEYYKATKDDAGNVVKSEALSYTEAELARYQGLYAMTGLTEFAGDFYGKQCINGVMERNVGFKAFDNAGQLIDYSSEQE